MSEELSELQEHAEHAKHDPTLAPISVTMAVLAVMVAVVTLLGHRAHTEEVVLQAKSSDQWAYYQAKNIRRHEDEIFVDLAAVEPTTDAAASAKLHDKYAGEAARYKDEQKEIEDKAREMETEVDVVRKRADRFDLAEVFLEVGLVITSITLLSGRRLFWYLGMLLGVVGLVVASTGFLVH
jgi:preprotein translocase subunit SecD